MLTELTSVSQILNVEYPMTAPQQYLAQHYVTTTNTLAGPSLRVSAAHLRGIPHNSRGCGGGSYGEGG